jgi:hypothetical protein
MFRSAKSGKVPLKPFHKWATYESGRLQNTSEEPDEFFFQLEVRCY